LKAIKNIERISCVIDGKAPMFRTIQKTSGLMSDIRLAGTRPISCQEKRFPEQLDRTEMMTEKCLQARPDRFQPF
jgi:hypothetical protein